MRRAPHFLTAASLPFVLFGCSQETDSDLNHNWEESAQRFTGTCDQRSNLDPDLSTLKDYVGWIVNRINDRNGSLLDQHCITVERHSNILNASVDGRGNFYVPTGTLDAVEKDLWLAAILSHEMGHLLTNKRRSSQIGVKIDDIFNHPELFHPIPEELADSEDFRAMHRAVIIDLPKAISLNEKFIRWYGWYTQRYTIDKIDSIAEAVRDNPDKIPQICSGSEGFIKACKALVELENKFKVYVDQMQVLEESHGLEPQKSFNHREQDADELGFELYTKAGGDPQEYINSFYNIVRFSHAKRVKHGHENSGLSQEACSEKIKEYKLLHPNFDEPFSVARGAATHPNTCWRVWNLERELYRHQAEVADAASDLPSSPLFDADLIPKVRETLKWVYSQARSRQANHPPVIFTSKKQTFELFQKLPPKGRLIIPVEFRGSEFDSLSFLSIGNYQWDKSIGFTLYEQDRTTRVEETLLGNFHAKRGTYYLEIWNASSGNFYVHGNLRIVGLESDPVVGCWQIAMPNAATCQFNLTQRVSSSGLSNFNVKFADRCDLATGAVVEAGSHGFLDSCWEDYCALRLVGQQQSLPVHIRHNREMVLGTGAGAAYIKQCQ